MIITSFGQQGYEQYGKRFIETFLQHWKDEKLIIYYEVKPDFEHERVEFRSLLDIPDVIPFFTKIQDSEDIFQGLRPHKETKLYDYRYDAYRFCRKVFAVTDAAINYPNPELERLAWVDADVIFHDDVPENYLSHLLPDDKYIAYLGRDWSYTESGFLVFNPKIDCHLDFMLMFRDIYLTGAFRYLGEWHDCYQLDFLMTLTNVPRVNLAHGIAVDHVFINSELGRYMDHLKGPKRKKLGRSQMSESITDHPTEYWRPNLEIHQKVAANA